MKKNKSSNPLDIKKAYVHLVKLSIIKIENHAIC